MVRSASTRLNNNYPYEPAEGWMRAVTQRFRSYLALSPKHYSTVAAKPSEEVFGSVFVNTGAAVC